MNTIVENHEQFIQIEEVHIFSATLNELYASTKRQKTFI